MAIDTVQPRASQRGKIARDRLLQATSELMRERNALDVPVADIAVRARLNTALIRYHFGSKEGLIFALLERDMREAVEKVSALVALPIPPEQKMRMHLHAINSMFANHPYLNRLIQATGETAHPTSMMELCDRLLRPAAEAQAHILEAGVLAGEFKPVDPEQFYFFSLGACDGLHSSPFSMRALFAKEIDSDARQRYAEFTVDFIMAGLLLAQDKWRDKNGAAID
jgi:Transcriptional regulator